MHLRFAPVSALLFVLLTALPASAETYRIITKGTLNSRHTRVEPRDVDIYEYLVPRLEGGDELIYSVNGKETRFMIKGKLGSGTTTKVLDIGDGRALRVPFMATFQKFVKTFRVNQAILSRHMKDVVRVDAERSSPHDLYAVVYNENIEFTLPDLTRSPGEYLNPMVFMFGDEPEPFHPIGNAPDKSRYYEALMDFARDMALFKEIPDLRPDQIGWNGSKWILFDVGQDEVLELAKISYSPGAPFAIDEILTNHRIPADIRIRMKEVSREERARRRAALSLTQRCVSLFYHPLLSPSVIRDLTIGR